LPLVDSGKSSSRKILSGTKKFEYRTRRCRRNVGKAILCATLPVGKVVGEAVLDEVIEGTPGGFGNLQLPVGYRQGRARCVFRREGQSVCLQAGNGCRVQPAFKSVVNRCRESAAVVNLIPLQTHYRPWVVMAPYAEPLFKRSGLMLAEESSKAIS